MAKEIHQECAKNTFSVLLTIILSLGLTGCNLLKSEKAQIMPAQDKQQIPKKRVIAKTLHRHRTIFKSRKTDLTDEIFKETDVK